MRRGIGYALLLSALGVIFGVIIGLIICLFRMHDVAILRWIGTAYVEVIRGTPMLVQLMIIYYGLSLTFGINFSAPSSGYYHTFHQQRCLLLRRFSVQGFKV